MSYFRKHARLLSSASALLGKASVWHLHWMHNVVVCPAERELNALRPEVLIACRKVLRLATAAVAEGHRVHCGGKY